MGQDSPFATLGQGLQDFLSAQFTPPPGTSAALGFLGGGIAVDPSTFYETAADGQQEVNTRLVNDWLNVVVDKVVPVVDAQASESLQTANALMREIAWGAASVAAPGTPGGDFIGHLRNAAEQALGPDGTVNWVSTAPSDWYDPSKVPGWAHYSNTASAGTPPPSPPVNPGLWNWRTIVPVRVPPVPPDERPPARITEMVGVRREVPDVLRVAALQGGAAAAADTTSVSLRERVVDLQDVDLLSVAARNAQTQDVQASSLTLSLDYLLVELSRESWWTDALVTASGWYVPLQPAGSLCPGAQHAGQSVGVPVRLVLTGNVTVSGTWTDEDRTAASGSTHFGVWSLDGHEWNQDTQTLTIRGMQAIACIYSLLPALPPADDPALVPPQATA